MPVLAPPAAPAPDDRPDPSLARGGSILDALRAHPDDGAQVAAALERRLARPVAGRRRPHRGVDELLADLGRSTRHAGRPATTERYR